jgi:hypothetical protein
MYYFQVFRKAIHWVGDEAKFTMLHVDEQQ